MFDLSLSMLRELGLGCMLTLREFGLGSMLTLRELGLGPMLTLRELGLGSMLRELLGLGSMLTHVAQGPCYGHRVHAMDIRSMLWT
jgi:hypothetical protein